MQKNDDKDSRAYCENQSEPELVKAGMSRGCLNITFELRPEIDPDADAGE